MRTLYETQKINMSKIDKVFLTVQQELYQIQIGNAKIKTSKTSKFDLINIKNQKHKKIQILINKQ